MGIRTRIEEAAVRGQRSSDKRVDGIDRSRPES